MSSGLLVGRVQQLVLRRGRGSRPALTDQPAPAAAAPAPSAPDTAVQTAFARAAAAYDVPGTSWSPSATARPASTATPACPARNNGYGMMHLVSNPGRHTLERAARLTGASVAELSRTPAPTSTAGQPCCRALADEAGLDAADRDRLGAWYPVAARGASGGESAPACTPTPSTTSSATASGPTSPAASGSPSRRVRCGPSAARTPRPRPSRRRPRRGPSVRAWNPAYPGNYSAGRGSAIHDRGRPCHAGLVRGLHQLVPGPGRTGQRHYVVRSSDGQVTQTVRERDTAWHARSANPHPRGRGARGLPSAIPPGSPTPCTARRRR
ncbi:N-acetylmuramoyl-L-alanine amidase [Streptomyces thinghirensis]|nr:N-acetylmuramoyl-L-alanine amidase [Streptomyces thinghirensis]